MNPYNTTPDQCSAVREPQVGAQLSRLAETEELLNRHVCDLESKIKPVLMPELEGKPECSQPEPTQAPLAERLRNHTNALYTLCSRLKNIISRVEV